MNEIERKLKFIVDTLDDEYAIRRIAIALNTDAELHNPSVFLASLANLHRFIKAVA